MYVHSEHMGASPSHGFWSDTFATDLPYTSTAHLLQRTITPTTLIQENCTPGNKQYTKFNEGNGKGRKHKVMTTGLVHKLTVLFDLIFVSSFLVCHLPISDLKG